MKIIFSGISPIFFFPILIFFSSDVFSQDIIVRTNNDSIRAKVVSITGDKIKFKFSDAKNSPIQEIHKNNVKQIIYQDGTKLTIVYNRYEVPKDMIIKVPVNVIKVDLFAPLLNHFTVGYERRLKPGKNLEVKASLIGTNISTFLKHAEGFFLKCGVKFIRQTESYSRGLKYMHPVKGNYFKPEIMYTQYERNEDFVITKHTHYVVSINFGRQYMITKSIALDYFGGAGFGIQNTSKENDLTYGYSHIFFGKKIPIVITGGLTMGILF